MKTLRTLSICLAFLVMNITCMNLIDEEILELKTKKKNISRILLSVSKDIKNEELSIADATVMHDTIEKLEEAGFSPKIHYCNITRKSNKLYYSRQKKIAKLLEKVRNSGSVSNKIKKVKNNRPIGVLVFNEYSINNVHKHNIHHKEILESHPKNKNVTMLILAILNSKIVMPEKINKDSLNSTFKFAKIKHNYDKSFKIMIDALEKALKK